MKRNKQFCVKCSQEVGLVIVPKAKYEMYHCRQCGEEICRVGDNDTVHNQRLVKGGLGGGRELFGQSSENILDPRAERGLAMNKPELLSDEHRLWKLRDEEAEFQKAQKMNQFKLGYNYLTARQKQVVGAVDMFGSQIEAAKALGISYQVVSETLKAAEKKIRKYIKEYPEK